MGHYLPPAPFPAPIMQCVKKASAEYHVPSIVLLGIIKTESNGNPNAINRNRNGTVDIGLMQINSSWVQKLASSYSIKSARRALANPCYNVRVGAWILRSELSAYGGWRDSKEFWQRVGNYHSKSSFFNRRYQGLIVRNIRWIAANTAWW